MFIMETQQKCVLYLCMLKHPMLIPGNEMAPLKWHSLWKMEFLQTEPSSMLWNDLSTEAFCSRLLSYHCEFIEKNEILRAVEC